MNSFDEYFWWIIFKKSFDKSFWWIFWWIVLMNHLDESFDELFWWIVFMIVLMNHFDEYFDTIKLELFPLLHHFTCKFENIYHSISKVKTRLKLNLIMIRNCCYNCTLTRHKKFLQLFYSFIVITYKLIY